MTIRVYIFPLIFLSVVGCSKSDNGSEPQPLPVSNETAWSIPQTEVLGSFPPFPLITENSFVPVSKVQYPDNHSTALISFGPNELRAYPNAYLALYEVINNEYNGKEYAITHCPQTVSTICWNRKVESTTITLKASGYLYNENLMPTDIESGTIWSQMLMRGVRGKYDYVFHDTFNTVETDWKTVRTLFPNAKVYRPETEETSIETTIIESEPTNRDFFRYGILSGINNVTVHIFSYDLFDGEGLVLKTTLISGKRVLVIGNKKLNFISSYLMYNNTKYMVDPSNPYQFIDDQGNVYNAMGLVLQGPDKDLQLQSPRAYTAAWFAWQDFFDHFVFEE
ncbi:DUF3179 domain-containing (seleno)protein [Pareuzebyella sediminis]|uniref:DUF3179 domain-containing (seleno)protein n=1 Tax=Pareuzebyella sediminis TaxID=2607998 RepID=UPI0011ECB633|nr:DUF3179 domain-containing (seleno)protein [Pareuzebyella sediminis]